MLLLLTCNFNVMVIRGFYSNAPRNILSAPELIQIIQYIRPNGKA